jgi:branched-chain amino acid transport system substrate-binding protein
MKKKVQVINLSVPLQNRSMEENKMKRKGNWIVGFSVFITLVMLMCFPYKAAAEETVKIGLLAPFTGPLALEGEQTWQGIQIAADIVNDKGGIWGGKKIEFVRGDDAGSPEKAISEMERLITKEKLDLIVGGYSSATAYAASEINEKYKKVFWNTSSTAEQITTRGLKYIFRWNGTTGLFGSTKVDFTCDLLSKALGKKVEDIRVAIASENSIFGATISKVEVAECKKKGLNLVAHETYSHKTVDLSPLIMKLMAVNPDVIFLENYKNDGYLFWRQCRELNFNFPAIIDTGVAFGHPEWLEMLGSKGVEGTLPITQRALDPRLLSPKGRALQEECLNRFAKKFNISSPGSLHFMGFEPAHVLFSEVLPMAGSLDPEKIREAALKVNRNWKDTVTGIGARYAPPDHPNAGHNLSSRFFVSQWQNGKLPVVYPLEAAGAKLQVPMPTWDQRRSMK